VTVAVDEPKCDVSGLHLSFRHPKRPPVHVLGGIDLKIGAGEFVSIVGQSGCGKSTLLLAIDGLLPIDRGSISIDGHPVRAPGPDRAVVFQDASLLPWRTVLRNITYGLELQHRAGAAARDEARRLIELVGLAGHEDRFPRQLSGGMKQRVNLARALLTDPEMLLLDEPFAALDAQTREQMQAELLRIWSASRKTALFITHQIDEAVYLSDRVVVLRRGPAEVIADIAIDIGRPRGLEVKKSQRFRDYEDEIWSLIHRGRTP